MKARSTRIFVILSVLVMFSLSCSLMGLGGKSEKSAEVEDTSPASKKSNALLGEEYRSEMGGFSIQKVKDYDFEDVIGIVNMRASDADPNIGPGIMVFGGTMDQEYTTEEIFEKLGEESPSISLSKPKKMKVNGVNGLVADITGTYNDQDIKGKVFVAMVTPTQQFNLQAIAPEDRWKELSPVFEAVLESASFFEPVPEVEVSEPEEIPTEAPMVEVPDAEVQSESSLVYQWASYAEASSAYSNQDWSAMQATGEPNVDVCADSGKAWASKNANTIEWIELFYDVPVVPTEINIYQSYNPSQVVDVYMTDINGDEYIVWSGEPVDVEYCPDLMTITIELEEKIMVDRVRVVVDQSVMGWGWSEIDAVELVGYTDEMPVVSNPAPAAPGGSSGGTSGGTSGGSSGAASGASDVPAPTNYSGWMAGPVYQGYLKVTPGKTKEGELNKLLGLEGKRSTENWKPRPDHKDTYIFDTKQDKMLIYISVTTDGVVYYKHFSTDARPSDYTLDTVVKQTYDQLDVIFKKDGMVPYNVVANALQSPGFLLEQKLREDGRLEELYQWFHANGDRMSGAFYDGKMTGIAGLAFIPKQ